jgi:glycosyltransferase involved in cell wall biosynthesis
MHACARAAKLVTGDLVYAVKPKLASFGLALAARSVRKRPLLLDIDDYDLGFSSLPRDIATAPWALLSSASELHTRILTSQSRRADAVTVSSTPLFERHGGVWIPHARDEELLKPVPAKPNRATRTVMFLGTPRQHKGLYDLLKAFSKVRAAARLRIVGGALDANLVRAAEKNGDSRVSVEPPVPMSEMPSLLATADVIAIPQTKSSISNAQLPAKLLDAMAMSKAIVSTRVGDIPKWLADGAGVVVEPDDPDALGLAIDSLLQDSEKLRLHGLRARDRFLAYGSFARVRPRLVELCERLMKGAPPIAHAPFDGSPASGDR